MTYPQQPDADLDRLHRAVEGIFNPHRYHYRGEGRTFAFLSLIIGEMELSEDQTFLYITDSRPEAEYTQKWLMHIYRSYVGGESLVYLHDRFQITTIYNSRIMFCGVETLKSKFCGNRFSRIFWDVSEERCRQLIADGTMHDIQVEMNVHLLPDGDIV